MNERPGFLTRRIGKKVIVDLGSSTIEGIVEDVNIQGTMYLIKTTNEELYSATPDQIKIKRG